MCPTYDMALQFLLLSLLMMMMIIIMTNIPAVVGLVVRTLDGAILTNLAPAVEWGGRGLRVTAALDL